MLIVLCVSTNAQNPDWKIVHPAPHSNELHSFQYVEEGNVIFALGDASTLMKSSDDGVSYTTDFNTIEDIGYDIHFFDEQNGLISTRFGVYSTMNGGESWSIDSLLNANGNFAFINRDTGYLLLPYDDFMYKTDNAGSTWSKITLPDDMRSGHVTAENHIFITTFDGSYVSANGGDSFDLIDNFSPYFITSFEENAYAIDGDELYISGEAGTTWTLLGDIPTSYEELFIGDNTTGFMLTGTRIYSSTDGFSSWKETSLNGYYNTIEKGANGSYFLVGEAGQI